MPITDETPERQDTSSPGPHLPVQRARKGESLATIERIGIDHILDRVANGESLAKIAEAIGVHQRTLCYHLMQPAHAAEYARAQAISAEVWADTAWDCLQLTGDDVNAAAVNLARHKEQHCMRRAGIANARYSEQRQQVEVTGANGGPIQQAVVVYMPANTRDARTIEHEG